MTLRTLNYGNYGIFLIMGNAGFCPSAVVTLGNLVSLPTIRTLETSLGLGSRQGPVRIFLL